MHTRLKQITVALASETVDQLQELADRLGKTRGDVVRAAMADHLQRNSVNTSTRLITLAEFTSGALDVMMEENYPSRRRRLVDEVARRLETFHGIR